MPGSTKSSNSAVPASTTTPPIKSPSTTPAAPTRLSTMAASAAAPVAAHGAPNMMASSSSGQSSPGATKPRMFEFSEGTSNKFWEVVLDGATVSVRFGKIGTAGMTKPKVFPTDVAAKKYYDELIAEKTGKGYVEI